jgi:hypothetical protein
MFIRPMTSASALPAEWVGIEHAFELDGDAPTYLIDAVGYVNLIAPAVEPTKVTGKIGDARNASTASPSYTCRTGPGTSVPALENIYRGPEATVLCWVKHPASGNSYPWVVDRNIASGNVCGCAAVSNAATTYLYTAGGAYITERVHAGVNQWSFHAVTMSATTGWRFSINDGAVATSATTPLFNTSEARVQLFTGWGSAGLATVDMFRLFNRKLSADEITYHYNSGNGRAYAT